MPANLGCFGVADNIAEWSIVTDTSVKDCSERITEQSHRVIFQVAENGGATFTWFVTIAADLRRGLYSKELALSVISANL